MTPFNFWIKITQKGYFRTKAMKITIEFYIFKLIYNQFRNILRLFDVLPNFPFSASETMDGYYYKHGLYKLPHELPNGVRLRILGN